MLLLDKGAKVNLAANLGPNLGVNKGLTPLMVASLSQNINLVKILIDATIKSGSDINQSDSLGSTALDYALASNVEITRLLLKAGAKLPSFSHRIKYFMKSLITPRIVIPTLAGITSLVFGAPLAVGIIFCVIALGFAAKMAYDRYKRYRSNNIIIQKILKTATPIVSISAQPAPEISHTVNTELKHSTPLEPKKTSHPIPFSSQKPKV